MSSLLPIFVVLSEGSSSLCHAWPSSCPPSPSSPSPWTDTGSSSTHPQNRLILQVAVSYMHCPNSPSSYVCYIDLQHAWILFSKFRNFKDVVSNEYPLRVYNYQSKSNFSSVCPFNYSSGFHPRMTHFKIYSGYACCRWGPCSR